MITASLDVLRKEPGHSEFIHSIVIGMLAGLSVGGGWDRSAICDCDASHPALMPDISMIQELIF